MFTVPLQWQHPVVLHCSQDKEFLPNPTWHNPNLSSFCVKQFALVWSLYIHVKSYSPSFYKPILGTGSLQWGLTRGFSFWSWTVPKPLFVADMLQTSDHFCDPPVHLLQQIHILLLVKPQSWMRYSDGVSRGENRRGELSCQPAGHASFDASLIQLALWVGCGTNVVAWSFPC